MEIAVKPAANDTTGGTVLPDGAIMPKESVPGKPVACQPAVEGVATDVAGATPPAAQADVISVAKDIVASRAGNDNAAGDVMATTQGAGRPLWKLPPRPTMRRWSAPLTLTRPLRRKVCTGCK